MNRERNGNRSVGRGEVGNREETLCHGTRESLVRRGYWGQDGYQTKDKESKEIGKGVFL